jgi:hypothetical protein
MSRPNSSGSNNSAKSTDSYASALSDDSYLATFKPADASFAEVLAHIRMVENNRPVLKERKVQSHELKKRDPNDTERRTDWTPQMEADYAAYKAKVDALTAAKAVQAASEAAAKASKKKPIAEQEAARNKALNDDDVWLKAGIAYVFPPIPSSMLSELSWTNTVGPDQSRNGTAGFHDEVQELLEHP